MVRRSVALAAALGALLTFAPLACSSGSSGKKGSGGSGGTQSDAASDAAGSGGTAGTGAAGSGGSGGGSAGADASCAPGDVTLQNDSFAQKGQVAFQGGFAKGECWASTYVPNACGYTLNSVLVLIGGGDAGNVQLDVGVWDVDATGKPSNQLAQTGVTISGASDVLSEVPLGSLPVAPRNGTPFAISMCQNTYSGPPSIASDTDGITSNRNWIFTNNQWVEASTLGVTGDWVMRAKITVQ